MAFSVRMWGVAKDGATKLFFIDRASWWDMDESMKDPRFVESNDTGSYSDYDANLSIEDFRVLREQYRKKVSPGYYKDEVAVLDKAIYQDADQYLHIQVNVYEWDSGM